MARTVRVKSRRPSFDSWRALACSTQRPCPALIVAQKCLAEIRRAVAVAPPARAHLLLLSAVAIFVVNSSGLPEVFKMWGPEEVVIACAGVAGVKQEQKENHPF